MIFYNLLQKKPSVRLWFYTLIFGFVTYVLIVIYFYIPMGFWDMYLLNRAAAINAFFLIGISFALSGLSYFFSPFKKLLMYRRDIGLFGFVFAFIHGTFSLYT